MCCMTVLDSICCCMIIVSQAPWGGVKNSGHGRDLGDWGLEGYLSVKQVTRYTEPDKAWDWYPETAVP